MNNMPIIKIEVETMKQAMHHAFSEQLLNIDKQFQEAIEKACDPKKIQYIIENAADKYITEVLEQEVKWYFLSGPGRDVIKERVNEKLSKGEYY